MTPAVATQDEDLLIISDDTSEASHDTDFSFNFSADPITGETSTQTLSQAPAASEDTLAVASAPSSGFGKFSFDLFGQKDTPAESANISQTLENSVAPIEAAQETPIMSDVSVDLSQDFSFAPAQEEKIESSLATEIGVSEKSVSSEISDISSEINLSVPVTETIQAIETPVEAVTSMDIAPTETLENTAAAIESLGEAVVGEAQTVSNASSESLNDILSATIAKLTLRTEAIAQDSSGKSAQITNIQAQIKALEEQVATLEGEISLLTAEGDKISKSIEALEEMKLDPVKEHNARRVVKK